MIMLTLRTFCFCKDFVFVREKYYYCVPCKIIVAETIEYENGNFKE
jgi:hypothetical protein